MGYESDEDRKLALQLMEYEKQVNALEEFSNDRKAQAYVCMAHDWFQIGMIEEAGRLLLRAEELSPGYFKDLMIQHTKETEGFDLLVKSFTVQLMRFIANQVSGK